MEAIQKNRIDKINDLHNKINSGLKTTVRWAIEVGKLLNEQKTICGHGNFENWIKDNCSFDKTQAYRYVMCNKYSTKVACVQYLNEAYRLIDYEKKQEKKVNEVIQRDRIEKFKKTGKKPDNWTRADDYEYKKHYDDNERDKRIKDFKSIKEKEKINKENAKIDAEENIKRLNNFFNDISNKEKERSKINMQGTLDDMICLFSSFLDNLPDDNRRIEACQNIIKFCKEKAVIFQRV